MNRRNFLIGSAVASSAAVFALKPSDAGASYSQYFSKLNSALRANGTSTPSMLVDMDLLDHNISELMAIIPPAANYRVAVKSIPVPQLVKYVMSKTKTNKLMVFHQPFLNHIADVFPDSDVLMGKPMPVNAAKSFYELLDRESRFQHEKNLQWLIDTEARLIQYLELAKQLGVRMRVNFEIDVGLHRGGFTDPAQLKSLMTIIENNSAYLEFSGFMGYDPQIVFFPKIIKSIETAYQESQAIYKGFVDYITTHYPQIDVTKLCLNGAGSYSVWVHDKTSAVNDITAGSCLVKPVQFDIPGLQPFKPAAFVATPVLKKLDGTNVPGLENFKHLQGKWNPNRQQTLFIYGGKWKAHYHSPEGLIGNEIYGTSTNQMIVNSSHKVDIDVDDHVFLRPDQSEFVFLQFGDVLSVRAGAIIDKWQILKDV